MASMKKIITHSPAGPRLQQKGESLCGCFAGAHRDLCRRRQEEEEAGRMPRVCPAGGQQCSTIGVRTTASLPNVWVACLSLRMHFWPWAAGPGQGSCPPVLPALQVSPFPLDNSITCTYFSFFFLFPTQKSSLSIRPVQKQHPSS